MWGYGKKESHTMKRKMVVVAAVCAGAVLGWVSRTAEVRQLREALEDAKRFIAVETVTQVPVQSVMAVTPAWRYEVEEEEYEEEVPPVASAPAVTVSEAASSGVPQGNPRGGPPQDWNNPAVQAERQAALENWMQQAAADTRQNIIEQGGLDEKQAMELDTLVDSMNQQVTDMAREWADYIRETGTLDADNRMRMMHDISSIVVATSDSLDQHFPSWRGGNANPMQLISPSAFQPFQDLRAEGYRIPGMRIFPGFGGGGRPPNNDGNRTN